MDKLEYFILKNSNIVEQLIKLEERNIVFESNSEDFNNWKSLAYKAILDEDIKVVNKGNNLIYESLFANGYKAESLDENYSDLDDEVIRKIANEKADEWAHYHIPGGFEYAWAEDVNVVSDIDDDGYADVDFYQVARTPAYEDSPPEVEYIKMTQRLKLVEKILSENDLREAAKEYYDQVKKDIELINKYPDILTDNYNSKESLINGLENDIIEPFELYDWIIATLNEHNILTEDYTRADDEWGDPYTYEEVYDNLKSLTNDFSEKDGNVRCWYEQEKIYGVDILKKYYKVVEASDARMTDGEDMSWIISYSGLKK